MIKLNKTGRPSADVRALLDKMNDYLDELSDGDKYKYSNQKYESYEDLQRAWQEMSGEEGEIISETKKGADSVEDAHIESETYEAPTPKAERNFDSSIPDSFDFDPNIGETIKRGYNEETVTGTGETIAEPIYSTETIDLNANTEQPNGQQAQPNEPISNNTNQSEPKEKPQAVNPQLNEADDKTKRIAAEQLVDVALNFYDTLHEWAKPLAKIKDKKLNELERKGLIDPDDSVPVGNGNTATARELIMSTNESIEEVLTPDPTFHAKVREPMIREFSKRGLGLTDMQTIAINFGIDIGTKMVGIVQVRKQFNSILDGFKEMKKDRQKYSNQQSQNATKVEVDSIQSDPMANKYEETITETEEVYP